MEAKFIYKDINQVLYYIVIQIKEGLPFAKTLPEFRTPKQIFYYLKSNTVYKNDFKGVELLQSLPTLLTEANRHNIKGAGDCDCFTIAAITILIANGFKENYIYLVGRSKFAPVHIYCSTIYNGKEYFLDLTNPKFNTIRNNYKFFQKIAI